MAVFRFDEQQPKLERMARYWPRTIQEYWRLEQHRQSNLSAKLLAETIRVGSRSKLPDRHFPKRKSYTAPPH